MTEKEAATAAQKAGEAKAAKAAVPPKAQEKALTAMDLEREFKEHSVAEFFKKNRQMLGFVGKVRSLTTIVHEGVTNSLDATEDAKVLPEIAVEVQDLENGHYKVAMEDNGTGVPKSKVGLAFGKMLAGTKFHQRMQKRGQQGIGISAVTLFGQITAGKEAHVKTSSSDGKVYECDVSVDVNRNAAIIKNEREYSARFRGTRYEGEFSEVEYKRGEYGPFEYLRRTAIANPHSQLTLIEPNKEITVFPRASKELPKKPKKVLPHPLGITTSDLIDMAHVSDARKISSFLQNDFSRVSSDKANELEDATKNLEFNGKKGIDFNRSPKTLTWPEAEAIVNAIQKVKWIAPEMDALRPIGQGELERSLKNLLKPEFFSVAERKPKVFRGGIPFMVEAAIAYGGEAGVSLNGAKQAEVMRFANRVPLLFDTGSCAITEAVKTIDWSRYELRGWENLPLTVFVNFTSVYVPYTGAGKLAIAAEGEIIEEIRMALMECARNVSMYLRGIMKAEEQERRRTLFFRYIEEVAQALHAITKKPKAALVEKLRKMAEERTALAMAEEEGEDEELEKLEKAAKQAEE
jgi:DNA topoisomerase-6 subunit B